MPPIYSRGKKDSPQRCCACTSTLGKNFKHRFDATHSASVAKKPGLTRRVLLRFFGLPISFRILAYSRKAQTGNSIECHAIALFIARQSCSRPLPVLAEYARTLSTLSTPLMCSRLFLNSLLESLSDFVATINRDFLLCSSHS